VQNTLISIVNDTNDSKALRVRFRQAAKGIDVGAFNVFLSPRDVWTAAVVPSGTSAGAKVISRDKSCVSPGIPVDGINLAGSQASADTTNEGFIEVLEMAAVTGTSATAIAPGGDGTPANCSAVVADGAVVSVAPPTGGVSGSTTIINVANGLDFSLNGIALTSLSSAAFYRPAADSYPSFNANEINATSLILVGNVAYRSQWARAVDAVSAVLMTRNLTGEFVLDAETRSQTDFVLTYPTRTFYVNQGPVPAPFSDSCQEPPDPFLSGERFTLDYANRDGALNRYPRDGALVALRCASTEVFSVQAGGSDATPQTSVFGSTSNAWQDGNSVILPATFQNGFVHLVPGDKPMTSLPTSTRTDLATGLTTVGAHTFAGLPIVGFVGRTFENGTLPCAAGNCQGNYGAAFPLRTVRAISP